MMMMMVVLLLQLDGLCLKKRDRYEYDILA